MSQSTYNKIERLANEAGLKYKNNGGGHIQIIGPLLVNYYPLSKNRSCYVSGTVKAHKNVTPEQAIGMCSNAPLLASGAKKNKRNKNSRAKRAALLKKGVNTCQWCSKPIDLDTSTLEHVIPLAIGGLDNANNRTLACYPCNQGRASNMPELPNNKADK